MSKHSVALSEKVVSI